MISGVYHIIGGSPHNKQASIVCIRYQARQLGNIESVLNVHHQKKGTKNGPRCTPLFSVCEIEELQETNRKKKYKKTQRKRKVEGQTLSTDVLEQRTFEKYHSTKEP